MKLIGKNITLTKISDDMFNGNHPNGYNVGSVLSGYIKKEPKLAERFYLFGSIKGMEYPRFATSAVKRVDFDKMILKTEIQLIK